MFADYFRGGDRGLAFISNLVGEEWRNDVGGDGAAGGKRSVAGY